MRWGGFERACPEIGELARARFERDQLVMLGTIRLDGLARSAQIRIGEAQVLVD